MTDEKYSETGRKHQYIPEEAREHFKAAGEELRKSFESMFPPGFVEHRRAARREMLLAVRSLIDAAIEHTEKQAKETPGTTTV